MLTSTYTGIALRHTSDAIRQEEALVTITERPWYAYVSLLAIVVVLSLTAIPLHGTQISSEWRWGVTILFVVVLGTVATLNDGFHVLPGIDRGTIDYYTLVHFSAGLAFGAWCMPLWWVVIVVVGWEFYEAYVPGWGENEKLSNRIVDISVALIGWLLVAGFGTGWKLPLFLN